MDFSKLDNLLESLPPPPKPTFVSIPTKTKFLFIGPPHKDEDAIYALEDKNHRLVSEHAKNIPSTSWNSSVLIGLNMKLSNIEVKRSPRYIMKSGSEYPKSTHIHCYWCRHGFKTQPIGIPYRRSISKKDYSCFGNYCSFECAMAGSTDTQSSQLRLFAGSLLCLMRKNINKIPLKVPLQRAPHWSSLRAYGGYLTIEEFRSGLTTVRAIPEFLRLFPVGYNLFRESRKVNRCNRPRSTASLFEQARARSKIMKKGKKKNYKTNFSHIKLKLKKKGCKNSKLLYKAPKKTKLKLF